MPIIQNLIVDEFGAHVGKYSERLKVTKKGETLAQAPLLHLESLTIANRGVSLSAEVVRECSERGIPIHFISGTGRAYASLYSAGLTGTVATRRAQLQALDSPRGLYLALAFGRGKVQNQANFLKYMAKYRKESAPEVFEKLRELADQVLEMGLELERVRGYPEVAEGEAVVEDLRAELMGMEGMAGRLGGGGAGASGAVRVSGASGAGGEGPGQQRPELRVRDFVWGVRALPGVGRVGPVCRVPPRRPAGKAEPDTRFRGGVSPAGGRPDGDRPGKQGGGVRAG